MPTGVYDRSKSKRKQTEKCPFTCLNCGKVTELLAYRMRARIAAAGEPPKYCSHPCFIEHTKNPECRVSTTCDGCGTVFQQDRHRIMGSSFCTKACYIAHVDTRVAFSCQSCGETVTRQGKKVPKDLLCEGCRSNAKAARAAAKAEAKAARGATPRPPAVWNTREYARAYHRKYAEANRERINELSRAWGKRNPEKKQANAATRRSNGGRMTGEEWVALKAEFGNVCVCCGASGKLEADHVIPVVQGGTGDVENIQPLCRRCNAAKHATAVDYRPMARLRARLRQQEEDKEAA